MASDAAAAKVASGAAAAAGVSCNTNTCTHSHSQSMSSGVDNLRIKVLQGDKITNMLDWKYIFSTRGVLRPD